MKLKTLIICALVITAGLSSSCKKEAWQKPYIEFRNAVSNQIIDLNPDGGSFNLSMMATRDWKIDSIKAWMGVNKESGSAMTTFEEIVISAPENPGETRSSELVFKAGPIKEYLTIRQKGTDVD